MGMIFQSAALFDSMTVLDNVMFPLNMFSNDTLRDRTRRAMFCLERVNLIEAKDKFPGEISGGMQKRRNVKLLSAMKLSGCPNHFWCLPRRILNVCNNNVRYLKNIMYSVRP